MSTKSATDAHDGIQEAKQPSPPLPPPPIGVRPTHDGVLLLDAEALQRQVWTCCRVALRRADGYSWLPYLAWISAVLSGISGLAIFASLEKDPGVPATVTVACVVFGTAIVAGLQTAVAGTQKSLTETYRALHALHHRIQYAVAEAPRTPVTKDNISTWTAEFEAIDGATRLTTSRRYKAVQAEIDNEMERFRRDYLVVVPTEPNIPAKRPRSK